MITSSRSRLLLIALASLATSAPVRAMQQPGGRAGPPVQGAEEDIPLVARFDRNNDKILDHDERAAAREYLAAHPELRAPARGRRLTTVGSPGPRLSEADVKTYPSTTSLYDPTALRTFFLEFEHPDWEQELEAFWHTDVEIAATLRVDGKTYKQVGVSFRGNNSFTGVPAGLKRPFSLTMDFVEKQDLLGHTSLNLLNSNQDPSFLRSPLYLDIAREYIPAPKANFVRVVINGESWGLYINQQTFSKEFVTENFQTSRGTRWKSPNNSVGGGMSYLGEDIGLYRRWYEMKGKDDPEAWRKRRRTETGNPTFDEPTRSLQPLQLARGVGRDAVVRLVVGQNDEVVPPAHSHAYATALRQRGIDVAETVLPGLGHNILFAAPVIDAVTDVLTILNYRGK